MTRHRFIVLMLIGLIVAAGTYWIVGHWSAYRGLLVELWPIVVGSLVAVASVLEVVWWLRFDPWYYRTGPKICSESWQTSGRGEQLREAVRPVLTTGGWVGRESPGGFFVRRRGLWRFGSRVSLHLEDTDQGTAVNYEVRPVLAAPLWLIFVASIVLSRFRVFLVVPIISWFIVPMLAFVTLHGIVYYVWLAPREAKRLARVGHIRRALARYRLGVCEECGYDLFGHSGAYVCPECGTKAEPA